MSTWVLVPVKQFETAKTRLAPVLNQAERTALAEAMMLDTLAVLQTVKGLSGIAVVTRDPAAKAAAEARGATVIEDDQTDLNGSLELGRAELAHSVTELRLMIVPTDLPQLAADDVRSIIAKGQANGGVVIAPDQKRDGTNMLFLGQGADLQFFYGPGSFKAHCAQALKAGLGLTVFDSDKIASDLDTPGDLKALGSDATGPHVRKALHSIQINPDYSVGEAL